MFEGLIIVLKRKKILNRIIKEHPDIVMLQEAHSSYF